MEFLLYYIDSSITAIHKAIWQDTTVTLLLITGIVSTAMLGFMQVKHVRLMCKLSLSRSDSTLGISSWQSILMSLGGRIGTGNIAGVTGAIIFGGPGAIFWMWIAAFFGCATSFVESTLGQLYKVNYDNQYRGSISLYANKLIARATDSKTIGITVGIVISFLGMFSFVMLTGPQASAMVGIFHESLGMRKDLVVIILCVLFLLVAMGGIKRISSMAELLVPFMSVIYLLAGLAVLITHFYNIPSAFKLILLSAIDTNAVFGGAVGTAIIWGVKRGIYSNEAGMASCGPHIGGAVEVNHPAKQGLVQAFAVYIDTWVICTITALVLILTNSFNVYVDGVAAIQNLPGFNDNTYPVLFVINAFDTGIAAGLGQLIIAVILPVFAFTTIVNNYYMSETNAVIFNNFRPQFNILGQPWTVRLTQLITVISLVIGGIGNSPLAWKLAEVGAGIMLVTNLIVIPLGAVYVCRIYKDYMSQMQNGIPDEEITFNPKALNIHDADFWNK